MAEKYDVSMLFFEVQDQYEKMQILEEAKNDLKESYEKGDPENIKVMAKQLQIQLMESGLGHTLSNPGQEFLAKLVKEGMAIDVSKTHKTQITVKPSGNDKVAGQSSTQGKKEVPPIQRSSSPKNCNKGKMAASATQNASQPMKGSQPLAQTYTIGSQKEGGGPTKETLLQKELESKKEEIKKLEDELQDKAKSIANIEKNLKAEYGKIEQLYSQSKEDFTVLNKRLQDSQQTIGILSEENSVLKKQKQVGEQAYAELVVEAQDQKAHIKDLRKQLKEAYDNFKRKSKEDEIKYDTLKKEHQELKDRFSKVAGAKLQDGNPDITDLSDPNRAMKLEGRFSALYDDDWTDAFQAQTDVLKRSTKDAIQNLLDVLKKCYVFCNDVAEQQMDSLRMVFLHPVQDLCQTAMAKKDKPRIASKEDKILKDLRKQIGTQSTNEVKQQFIAKMSQEYKKSEESKKVMGESKVYFEKCAEICWMMVLHDPPLYMDMGVKPGDKVDLNYFRVYSNNGDKVDFLVWPPLHITGGGLLAKGVVEPVKKKK